MEDLFILIPNGKTSKCLSTGEQFLKILQITHIYIKEKYSAIKRNKILISVYMITSQKH